MPFFSTLSIRINHMPRELKLFAGASLFMGVAYSIFDATFNNFLNRSLHAEWFRTLLSGSAARAAGAAGGVCYCPALVSVQPPPGWLALVLGVAGSLLIGFASPSYSLMVIWLFVYSLGSHLLMPVASTIGMELARDGKTGQRLGQLNAIRNLAAVLGSFVVFPGFSLPELYL
jgi:MFS family permease